MSSYTRYVQPESTWSQFKRGFKIGFVAGYQATQQSSHPLLEPSSPPKCVIINGVALNRVQLIHLHLRGYYPPAGHFWYDGLCGAWGKLGGPCLGILPPNMNMGGGALQRGVCSPNTTGATVNGRLLHHFDMLKLLANGVPLGLGPLWIKNDGQYGLENSFTPIGRIDIYNMIVRSFRGAEAFSLRHIDGITRAHLEKELEELLDSENTRSYARHPHDDFSTRSYYRRPATSIPTPGTPHQSDREARARRERHRQAQKEREEKNERERREARSRREQNRQAQKEREEKVERERREREERFRREQQDRKGREKKEQQEGEAKARRDGEERRQRAKAAQEAKAKRWKEYNSAWEELKNSTAASRRSRDPRTSISWPTEAGSFRSCRDVGQADIEAFLRYGASIDARVQLLPTLKVERLRWHPDKVQQLFCARVDETTMNKVTEISQIVNQLYTYEQARRG